ncbi:MAG: hypothetical protein WKF41_17220 [Gaiellaceae bacterium]
MTRGETFELSARNELNWRRRGRQPVCRPCRHPTPQTVITEDDRRYWLDRFTLEEIRELAREIWPAEEPRRAG